MATRGYADAVALASGTGNVQATSGPTLLHAYSVRENAATAAAATVRIYDGTDNTGTLVASIELAADASETVGFGAPVRCANGVFVERVAGTTEGSLHTEAD